MSILSVSDVPHVPATISFFPLTKNSEHKEDHKDINLITITSAEIICV